MLPIPESDQEEQEAETSYYANYMSGALSFSGRLDASGNFFGTRGGASSPEHAPYFYGRSAPALDCGEDEEQVLSARRPAPRVPDLSHSGGASCADPSPTTAAVAAAAAAADPGAFGNMAFPDVGDPGSPAGWMTSQPQPPWSSAPAMQRPTSAEVLNALKAASGHSASMPPQERLTSFYAEEQPPYVAAPPVPSTNSPSRRGVTIRMDSEVAGSFYDPWQGEMDTENGGSILAIAAEPPGHFQPRRVPSQPTSRPTSQTDLRYQTPALVPAPVEQPPVTHSQPDLYLPVPPPAPPAAGVTMPLDPAQAWGSSAPASDPWSTDIDTLKKEAMRRFEEARAQDQPQASSEDQEGQQVMPPPMPYDSDPQQPALPADPPGQHQQQQQQQQQPPMMPLHQYGPPSQPFADAPSFGGQGRLSRMQYVPMDAPDDPAIIELESAIFQQREFHVLHRLEQLESFAERVAAAGDDPDPDCPRPWQPGGRDFEQVFMPQDLGGYFVDKMRVQNREAYLWSKARESTDHSFLDWLAGRPRGRTAAQRHLIQERAWRDLHGFGEEGASFGFGSGNASGFMGD
mmetsp:Transcript_2272/g.5396  ORF Transcript_2272/g.5396 Transcript_2272/m.5396 type:complete len:572 (-) Transcript_2272:256-1971(-)|eukprot:CAMPEP_0206444818 /NCGR_PEP_ID=MMETSP0324_2-20121206/15130_1 /ASSEMBLY_ACC=CAM_ASM_000836 /TAXON_ID=2866 /ORGANISM="Crypthecodinium cohnii, Strain Seligo" /LENGTH=571 /DNA_ID=CAMNT_0053912897 /DNA_START=247 /DNA_END=1962 /DNA_ORIENTATION=-